MAVYKWYSAFLGIEIINVVNGREDYAIWRWTNEKKTHKSRIFYTVRENRPYFRRDNKREYLDEFVR